MSNDCLYTKKEKEGPNSQQVIRNMVAHAAKGKVHGLS